MFELLQEFSIFNKELELMTEDYKETTLGLTYIHNPNCKIDCIAIGVDVGSYNEITVLDKLGISHFLEHMIFNGSKNYTKQEINDKTAFMGGCINASTSNNHTKYFCSCINNYTEEAIKILMDIVYRPNLTKEDTEKERQIILKEYDQSVDNEDKVTYCNIFRNTNDDRINLIPIGTKEGIKSITHEDLREYHSKYYTLSNSRIVISTSKPKEEIVTIIQNTIKELELDFYVHQVPGKTINFDYDQKEKEVVYSRGGKTQSSIYCYRIFDSLDYLVAECFSNILSNGLGARLTKRLREEKQLCYQCGSFIDDIGTNFMLVSMIKYSDSGRTEEIKKDIYQIYIDCIGTITDEELQAAKNAMIGDKATSEHSVYYAYSRVSELITNMRDYTDEDIQSISKEDIYSFINYYLLDYDDLCFSRFEPK